ncbi:MAG TPA: penicillin-binding protein 1A [Elusimicrobiota bacterium]|nr:penicillin-binding protein 1A [Elusimicrobiota bacterium]
MDGMLATFRRLSHKVRVTLLLLTFYCLLMTWAALTFRFYQAQLPPIGSLESYTPSLITRIYDVRNELVSELYVERRTVVPLPNIPLDFQRAVLAIEDRNFYDHWGVDIKGILRAFLANLRAGRTAQGGSTITQQLAKNIFLSHARTLNRKIKELLLTLEMERHFSKDEILELYLNQIYFGHGAYGVDAAARVFFGKNVADLTLPECALLAGLPKAPHAYSPFKHPARAIKRRQLVLDRMREAGYISEKEELQACGAPLNTLKTPLAPAMAPYFVEYVRLQLEPKYGSTSLYRQGFSIYTTLDLRMQKAAEETSEFHLSSFDARYAEQRLLYLVKNKKIPESYYIDWKKRKEREAAGEETEVPDENAEPVNVQGALIAIDPRTGGIRALVGGRDFQKSQFNRAAQARRQPGSTFKPFVWLAALESGFTAATVIEDYPLAFTDVERQPKLVAESTDYAVLREMVTGYYPPDMDPDAPDPVWAPKNWDDKYLGPVTLRKALALSRNLVSVRLIDRVGPRTVVRFAHNAGIRSPLDAVLSLGLGSSVVTPMELVGSFATFANNGVHMEPFAVQKVLDNGGKLLEEHVIQGNVAVSPQSNYLLTRLLHAVVEEGTARYARRLGRPAAGKTGTTQEMRDAWFVGYLPDLAAGCWIGYDDFTPLGKGISSAGTAVPWWTDFMLESMKYIPARDFPVPPGVVFAKIDAETGLLALPSCPHVALEAFRQNQVPQNFCDVNHEKLLPLISAETEIVE